MSSLRAGQVLLLMSTLAIVPVFGSTPTHRSAPGHTRTVSSHRGKRKAVSHLHGQRAIDSNRATEIQQVLIQKKYLSGAASGQWDTQTQAAMRQYQQDHGWQTKLTPDSRALISLGLGPNHTSDPVVHSTSAAATAVSAPVPAEMTNDAGAAEPVANTLASVHSITQ